MKDPRGKNFYRIQKKAQTTLKNLTHEELKDYLSYTEQMIEYAQDKKSRGNWIKLKKTILEAIER